MRDTVGQERLGRALGYSSMALSMGLLLGPVIGGVLYEYCGYFETFLPALILVGVEVGLRCLIVENGKGSGSIDKMKDAMERDGGEGARSREGTCEYGTEGDLEARLRKLDEPPSQHSTRGALDETQHLLRSPTKNPPSRPSRNAFLTLLRNPRFATSLLGLFILNSNACGFDAVLGPYISANFGFGPIHVAGLFLCLAIPQLLSPLTGVLTDRCGSRVVAAAGLALAVPSLASLALYSHRTTHPMLKLCLSFGCIGVATALVVVPLRVDAAGAVQALEQSRPGAFGPRGAQGRGFGLLNGVVAGGGLVGPLATGWLRVSIGWAGMALVMSGLSLGLLAVVVGFTGERSIEEKPGTE